MFETATVCLLTKRFREQQATIVDSLFFVSLKDPNVEDGRQIERRVKVIEENVEFEILDIIEVEYTPSEGERTSHDFVIVSKSVQSVFLKLLLPGVVDEVALVRNRVVRALHCRTKNESHKRRFLLEVNLQPSEIRPLASKGSTELRYLHSTRNLYDIMSHSANDSMIYVKLIRGSTRRVSFFDKNTKLLFFGDFRRPADQSCQI